jgi:hypothetical protein
MSDDEDEIDLEVDEINHENLKRFARQNHRTLESLVVLGNDPFTADRQSRRALAEWFTKLWRRYGIRGTHLHGFHYSLVSQTSPIRMVDGTTYKNTKECENTMNKAALDARFLGLVEPTEFIDRRSEPPIINDTVEEEDADIQTNGGIAEYELRLPQFSIPELAVYKPVLLQRYHQEVMIEKSTMDELLIPLLERYHINYIRGVGEMTYTRCCELMQRVTERAEGRPVRILYISDFDTGGLSMPVAVARKIEFLIRTEHHDVDLQVRSIVLTREQKEEYDRLPSIPLKKDDKRKARFEERFGEDNATELDALEAVYPGEFVKIVEREILRYYDIDLEDNIEGIAGDVADELQSINERVHEEHEADIEKVRAAHKKCCDAMQAALKTFEHEAQPILNSIESDLEDDAPSVDDYDWPDPEYYEGDEDDDPLYDSQREYLDQIDSYKEFQGKEVDSTYQTYICQNPTCGKEFQSSRSDAKTCTDLCRQQMNNALRRKNAPKHEHVKYDRKCAYPKCKKPFKAVQNNQTCCCEEHRDALYALERKQARPKAAPKICANPECKKSFVPARDNIKGCTPECAKAIRAIERKQAQR